ncbi:Annexin-like protein RJ4 isoform A [Glycine soja]|uniref:Annexin n=1 Tax=Glycine soja TaxID=3848 RepID=A0A445GXK5_GLYSO|nr:Annexin-like protein RJ4 isoform A [Glycine soja]
MATLVVPNSNSPVEDAEALHKSFEGWGTDEKTVIVILGHRTVYQRQQIRRVYEEIFQEDLVKRLESEIKGDFEKAVYRWLLEPADRDAVLANVAIKNGKNYNVIVEIATILSPEELLAVRRAYLNRYKHSLEEDVAAHTSGHLRQLLVGLVTSYRYVGDEINPKLAQTEAEILHDAVKEKKGSYEETIRVLTTRSKTQLVATFNRYREIHGTSISKKLVDEGSDEFQRALYTAIRGINDPIKYYEKVVRNAIKKVGTDEDALTRVVVSRAEKDLKIISEVYYKRNSVLLEHAIAKETSGDYKKFLLTLLGKED